MQVKKYCYSHRTTIVAAFEETADNVTSVTLGIILHGGLNAIYGPKMLVEQVHGMLSSVSQKAVRYDADAVST